MEWKAKMLETQLQSCPTLWTITWLSKTTLRRFWETKGLQIQFKLKEFITNPEPLKNIPNMDNDDPIVHTKLFKFIKSQGKSLLEYAWGKDKRKSGQFIEMKGEDEQVSKNEMSATEIEEVIKEVKDFNTQQTNNLTELCANIEALVRQLAQEKGDYKKMSEVFYDAKDYDKKVEMKHLYGRISETATSLQSYQNDLAFHLKEKVLKPTRKILAKYLNLSRAIERMLDLATDVEDLKSKTLQYHADQEKQETLKAEYQYYLNLLRNNFDILREDASVMQKRENKKLQEVVNEFYQAQLMLVEGQNSAWNGQEK